MPDKHETVASDVKWVMHFFVHCKSAANVNNCFILHTFALSSTDMTQRAEISSIISYSHCKSRIVCMYERTYGKISVFLTRHPPLQCQ